MRRPSFGFAVLGVLAAAAFGFALTLGERTSGESEPLRAPMRGDRVASVTDNRVARPGLLLVDAAAVPTLELSWQTKDGWRRCSMAMGYASAAAKRRLCGNLDAYVALGGTRLEKGAADPSGAIVRVGFYKREAELLMLEDPADGAVVRVRLSGVRFNQPVRAQARSLVQHMRYSEGALEACGAPSRLADVFLTANAADDLSSRIGDPRAVRGGFFRRVERVRVPRAAGGAVAPERSRDASVAAFVGDEGGVVLDAVFPYSAFRHVVAALQPPTPGAFSEPDHFHLEFQVVPARRGDGEGT